MLISNDHTFGVSREDVKRNKLLVVHHSRFLPNIFRQFQLNLSARITKKIRSSELNFLSCHQFCKILENFNNFNFKA